jgi:hypothetical protein
VPQKSCLETTKCERTSPKNSGEWIHDAGLDELLGLCYAPENCIILFGARMNSASFAFNVFAIMCLFRSVILFLFAAAAAGSGVEFRWHIRSPRWEVKTLADGFIPDTIPVPTTVQEQVSLPAPPPVRQSWTRLPSERTLYVLTAHIVKVMEDLDRDYKFVVQDPKTGAEMIAEIPDPDAFGPAKYRPAFRAARHTIDSIAGKMPGYSDVRFDPQPLVRLTGIGFFDQEHYAPYHGTAPNNREIHPVLRIEVLH